MNLKEYNKENCQYVSVPKTLRAAVRMEVTKGRFVFNKAAGELVGLKDRCRVVIFQDNDSIEDWYLEIVTDRGFIISYREKQSEYSFNNTMVAKNIIESIGFSGKNGRMLIAGTPTLIGDRKLWGILTINLKTKP